MTKDGGDSDGFRRHNLMIMSHLGARASPSRPRPSGSEGSEGGKDGGGDEMTRQMKEGDGAKRGQRWGSP